MVKTSGGNAGNSFFLKSKSCKELRTAILSMELMWFSLINSFSSFVKLFVIKSMFVSELEVSYKNLIF